MHHQHNPIAQRIDEMRRMWQEKVSAQTVLVRWLLKPEESRMYEGFCRLEASPYGALEELFVFFYTPFEDAETYSRHILCDWIKELRSNTEMKAALQKAGIDIDSWDYRQFDPAAQQRKDTNYDLLLIAMMDGYRRLLKQDNVALVLSVLPRQMGAADEFGKWLHQMVEQSVPSELRILILDHTDSNYWGSVFEAHNRKAVTLNHDLRLDEAMRQIATGGASHSPEVQFRKCMYEMGAAAQKKDWEGLHQWGKKAIEVGTRSGQKNLLATAYITYAGMLFNCKDHQTIQDLLDTGIRICKREITTGDETMKPLLLQFYGFRAADFQQQKNTSQAIHYFMLQGQEAHTFRLHAQSVSGYYKTFLLAQHKGFLEEQLSALKGALSNTAYLQKEEIRSSEYPYVAYEYHYLLQHNTPGTDKELAAQADLRMQEAFGSDWKAMVESLKQNFNRQHIHQAEAAAAIA